MRLTYLGHAGWLAEIGKLRLLFDPLLEATHHGTVFEVHPPRRILSDALRPDFVIVSHRHPDHFDVKSLARLARLDPDSVLLSSDELVASTGRALGFRTSSVLEAWDKVTLSEATLLTTPSFGSETEWGVILADAGGTVWNQVDTVMRDASDIGDILAGAARALSIDAPRLVVDLALARWQPLLEIEALLGERAGFPFGAYAAILEQITAMEARALIPSSAGSRHANRVGFMNRLVYPLSEARFIADVARCAAKTRVFPAKVGASYRVEGGATELDSEASALVEVDEHASDDRAYRPFELPPITDPAPENAQRDREISTRWLETELAPALARRYGDWNASRDVSLVVEVVGPENTDAYAFRIDVTGARMSRSFDPEYDVLNQIAASELVRVLDGKAHWGEPLLAGLLRSSVRAYDVSERGMRRLEIAPIFLYYALSYEESVRRSTAYQVRALTSPSASRP